MRRSWFRDRDDTKPNGCYEIERQYKSQATFDQTVNGIIIQLHFVEYK